MKCDILGTAEEDIDIVSETGKGAFVLVHGTRFSRVAQQFNNSNYLGMNG